MKPPHPAFPTTARHRPGHCAPPADGLADKLGAAHHAVLRGHPAGELPPCRCRRSPKRRRRSGCCTGPCRSRGRLRSPELRAPGTPSLEQAVCPARCWTEHRRPAHRRRPGSASCQGPAARLRLFPRVPDHGDGQRAVQHRQPLTGRHSLSGVYTFSVKCAMMQEDGPQGEGKTPHPR